MVLDLNADELTSSHSEVSTWASVLFEPSDIVEVRCLPPKHVSESLRLYDYQWYWAWRHYGPFPWMKAEKLARQDAGLSLINSTAGVRTLWELKAKAPAAEEPSRRFIVCPLNIYCSANPRIRPGNSKASNVPCARSLFVDFDRTSIEEAEQRLKGSKLPRPTMVVFSGHGVHCYWRLTELMLDLRLWTAFQKRLIRLLGSDSSIHDPPRIMRLPGFLNHNEHPAKAFIVKANPNRRYDLATFDNLLPHLSTAKPEPKVSLPVLDQDDGEDDLSSENPNSDEAIDRALAYMRGFPPAQVGERNSKMFDLCANVIEKFDLNPELLLEVATAYNARSPEPLDDAELEEVASKAFMHIHDKGIPRGLCLKRTSEVEPYQEPTKKIVSLAEWRSQMVERRIASLQHPGTLHFDGSPAGSGKSTADQAAMKVVGKSITFLPTHQGCRELVAELQKEGLTGASFPPINEDTCQRLGSSKNPGEARLAQKAGLNVGLVLCPTCPFYKDKTCAYQQLRQKASSVCHAAATHARSVTSSFDVAKDMPVVFIHENSLNLLRPTVRVIAFPDGKTASLRHLREVTEVAREACHGAQDLNDEEKEKFFRRLFESARELANVLASSDLLDAVKSQGDTGLKVPRIRNLPLKQSQERPAWWELLFYDALRRSGINLHSDALRLAIGYTCGELHSLTLAVDESPYRDVGGDRGLTQSLVGVWKVDPPCDAVVWFEDGTGNADLLRQLTGRKVLDETPQGSLAYSVPPLQVTTTDITRSSSGNVVRGILRGLLARFPQSQKVGLITLQRHIPELDKLEPRWRNPLARIDFFGSGQDRASNEWLECDLLLIVGTPRVPPSAVRHGLIQVGKFEDAAQDGKWDMIFWEGKPSDGRFLTVQGYGYQSPAWAEVHGMLVRDALLQAVARGRGLTDKGIPVVVCSNEKLNLNLAPFALQPISDSEAQVYEAFLGLTEHNVNNTLLVNCSVTTSDVAKKACLTERYTRKILRNLSILGLLQAKGERGGWQLADAHQSSPINKAG